MYHPQLAYCIVQFLEKDAALTEEVRPNSANIGIISAETCIGRFRAVKILAESQQHQRGYVPQ